MGETKQKHVLLRVGTISAYQYFGDREVLNGEGYPVSLVSDPVAELYLMAEHDIRRRLPKKLFAVLFTNEANALPSDPELVDIFRQTQRWDSFRRTFNPGYSLSPPRVGVDVEANLDFLGIPKDARARQMPRRRGVTLKRRDEERFGQAKSMFLRSVDKIRSDRGLMRALVKDGSDRRKDLRDYFADDDPDPMTFYHEQTWNKLPCPIDLGTFDF